MAAERDYLGKSLDIAVRLAVIGVIVLGAYRIFSPFMTAVVWGVVLAVALFPIYETARGWLGGSRKAATALFIVVVLGVAGVSGYLLGDSLISGAIGLVESFQDGEAKVPPPDPSVRDWPVVGERVYAGWQAASANLETTLVKFEPLLRNLAERVGASFAGLAKAGLLSIFSLIIAAILMATSKGAHRTAHRVARRLAGDEGPPIVDLMVGTIRSVVKGVILVAAIQSIMAAVGLAIAGVPWVGLWSLLVLMVAVMQLPPIVVLGPIAVFVFANNDNTAIAIFFAIWSIIVSASDGFLKPLLLGRGVSVPMLVILIGAIGGMLRAGVLGLFIGPVILAIAYTLFTAWVRDDDEEATKPAQDTSGA